MRDAGRTREEFVNHELQASDLRFFHGFTGTINHSLLTNQSACIGFLLYKKFYLLPTK